MVVRLQKKDFYHFEKGLIDYFTTCFIHQCYTMHTFFSNFLASFMVVLVIGVFL